MAPIKLERNMDSSIGGERSDQEKQKKKGRAVRPVLPADQNFSPFFAFIAKTLMMTDDNDVEQGRHARAGSR